MLEDVVYREMLRLNVKAYDCLCEGNITGAEIVVNMMNSLLGEANSAGIPVEKATIERDTLVKDIDLDKRIAELGEWVESLKRRYAC